MSIYKPYPAYKATGIEWIESIPKNWAIKPFFALLTELNLKNSGLIETNILSLSYGRIIKKADNRNMGLVPESYETYQIVESGDVVFRFTDLQNDKKSLRSAEVTERGIISSAYIVVRPQNIESSYFAWLMRSYDLCKVFYSLGGGIRQSLKFDDVKRLPIIIPSTEEQKQISEAINLETNNTDSLIFKKTRFIELLEEKSQILIAHYVTKGLNPNLKIKESGIEWADKIPLHWKTGRLRWFTKLYAGGTPSKDVERYWTDGTIPWINSGAVNQPLIADPSAFITEEAFKNSSAKWIPKGALVMALAGQGRTKGMVAQLGIEATCNQSMAAIIPNTDLDARYLFWWLKSNYINIRNQAGGELRDGLNLELIGNIKCPIPPINEQKQIANFIDEEIKKIEKMRLKTQESIDLLKQHRSAFIVSAVSGAIDLRSNQQESIREQVGK